MTMKVSPTVLPCNIPITSSSPPEQGLTLVHFSAQLERFLWYMGCVEGLFRGCLGGVWGVVRGVFVSNRA
jgi:hypothetical protein